MKKLLSCLFAVAILVINVIPCFAANPTLSISSNDYTVGIGDEITVSVSLSSGSNLGTLTFNVNYNTSQFEYIAGSASTGLFEIGDCNVASGGTVSFVCASSGVVTGSGTVASMRFRVLTTGGKISVSVVDATDENDLSVRVAGSSISLSCSHAGMVWETEKASTCTTRGVERGTCTCGYTTTREAELASHTYSSSTVIKEATCTTTGIEVGTCTVCGESGAQSPIPAKGHDYSEWVVTREATAETMGVKERICQICGDKKTQTIPTLIEGIDPEDTTGDDVTESTTEFAPIHTPEPSTNNYMDEIETETTTEANGIFGNAVGSDIAVIVVIALAVLLVLVLAVYMILIIRQKKK